MKRVSHLSSAVCVLIAAGTVYAQPLDLDARAVANAASYISTDFPNGGVSHGGMFIVKANGTAVRLGACGTKIANQFPIATNMNGTSMSIKMGSASFDVPMIYVVACAGTDQLAGIVPSNVPTGTGTLTVTYNGRSGTVPITVVDRVPGFFTLNQGGSGPAVIQNFNSATDLVVNTLATPAKPGQTEIIWGTGLGPDGNSDVNAPKPTDIPIDLELYVGGKRASVSYKGRSGCCTAIDQIVFQVPDGVDGCYVPVVAKIGNAVSNFTTMSVSSGGPCSDALNFSATDISTAQASGHLRVGYVDLIRNESVQPATPGATTGVLFGSDTAYAQFVDIPFGTLIGMPVRTVSTPGSCTILESLASPRDIFGPPVLLPAAAFKIGNAGAVNIAGPSGAKSIAPNGSDPYYTDTLGPITGLDPPNPSLPVVVPAFLDPGNYTVSAPGATPINGIPVGSFNAQIAVPAVPNFTNRYALAQVLDRTQPLSVTWTGADPNGYVLITGTSLSATSPTPGPHADFYCVERASAGQFTIPNYVLLSLPPSFSGQIAALQFGLGVGQIGISRFTASGLDVGMVRYNVTIGRSLGFQ